MGTHGSTDAFILDTNNSISKDRRFHLSIPLNDYDTLSRTPASTNDSNNLHASAISNQSNNHDSTFTSESDLERDHIDDFGGMESFQHPQCNFHLFWRVVEGNKILMHCLPHLSLSATSPNASAITSSTFATSTSSHSVSNDGNDGNDHVPFTLQPFQLTLILPPPSSTSILLPTPTLHLRVRKLEGRNNQNQTHEFLLFLFFAYSSGIGCCCAVDLATMQLAQTQFLPITKLSMPVTSAPSKLATRMTSPSIFELLVAFSDGSVVYVNLDEKISTSKSSTAEISQSSLGDRLDRFVVLSNRLFNYLVDF